MLPEVFPSYHEQSHKYFPIEEARKIARELQREDNFWNYHIVEIGNNKARIDVYTEDGKKVTEGIRIDT